MLASVTVVTQLAPDRETWILSETRARSDIVTIAGVGGYNKLTFGKIAAMCWRNKTFVRVPDSRNTYMFSKCNLNRHEVY